MKPSLNSIAWNIDLWNGVLRHIATPVATDSYSVKDKNRNFRQIQRIESDPCRHIFDRQGWHGFSDAPNLPPSISRNLERHAHDSSCMVVNNANAIEWISGSHQKQYACTKFGSKYVTIFPWTGPRWLTKIPSVLFHFRSH